MSDSCRSPTSARSSPASRPCDRLGHLRDVVGPDRALFVAQRRAGAIGRVGQILLVEHVFFVEHAGSAQHLMDDSNRFYAVALTAANELARTIPVVSSQLRRKLRPEGLIAEADWLGCRRIEVAVLEYSHHSLIVLAGFAVAALALFGAIAVGPYGRRGVRPALTLISFAAFAGSAFWLFTYLGMIDQRRAIEARLAELRAQALSPGSALACLERTGAIVETACAQALFAAPETLAAANAYTAARLDAVTAAVQFSGPRTPQFGDDRPGNATVAAAGSVRPDRQCADAAGLHGAGLQRHRGAHRPRPRLGQHPPEDIRGEPRPLRGRLAGAGRGSTGGLTAPTGGETRAPIPDKYTLPSSSSIPPVSIMNDEPLRPAPPPAVAKDRPASPPPPSQAAAEPPPASAPAALPRPKQPAKQQRRETQRSNAPLSIAPKR